MKVNYNVTGKERKRLAQTIGKAIGVDAIYKGVPPVPMRLIISQLTEKERSSSMIRLTATKSSRSLMSLRMQASSRMCLMKSRTAE